jgi:hypothetical protein
LQRTAGTPRVAVESGGGVPRPHVHAGNTRAMLTYILPTRPEEVVRLLKAEIAATHGQPELCYSVWEDYLIKEHLDCRSLGGRNGEDYDLVSADAVLNIEPRLEQNYWMLKVVAHRDVGPQKICDAAALIGAKLTLEQFEAVLGDRDKVVTVRLDVSKNRSPARTSIHGWMTCERDTETKLVACMDGPPRWHHQGIRRTRSCHCPESVLCGISSSVKELSRGTSAHPLGWSGASIDSPSSLPACSHIFREETSRSEQRDPWPRWSVQMD